MPSDISPSAQSDAIATLERNGFFFVCWFDAHDGNDGQCATMELRHRRMAYSHVQCEVDPDGLCNGQSVADYLASVRTLRS